MECQVQPARCPHGAPSTVFGCGLANAVVAVASDNRAAVARTLSKDFLLSFPGIYLRLVEGARFEFARREPIISRLAISSLVGASLIGA
jgi:hypothetical protein